MNPADIILTVILAAIVIVVIAVMIRNKKKGKGTCSCGCEGCGNPYCKENKKSSDKLSDEE